MVNAVEGRAGAERFEVPVAVDPELAIRGNDSTLATASDGAELAPHPAKSSYLPDRTQPPAIRVGYDSEAKV